MMISGRQFNLPLIRAVGFTVVEIVVVLILLGILSATAMSRMISATAFSGLTLTNTFRSHAQYAAQLAQTGAGVVTLGMSVSGGVRHLHIRADGVIARHTELKLGNLTLAVDNAGTLQTVTNDVALVVQYRNSGEVGGAAVGTAVLDVDQGFEFLAQGERVHSICFYPTGYVSALAC